MSSTREQHPQKENPQDGSDSVRPDSETGVFSIFVQNPFLLNYLFLFFITLLTWSADRRGLPSIVKGPEWDIAISAVRLWDYGTIERPDFYEWDKFFKSESTPEKGGFLWQDKFSLGRDGKLYQTHALFMSVTAAPFYGLFGYAGFLFYNQALVWLCLWSFYKLAQQIGGTRAAVRSVFALCCLSPILLWSFGFSYDVLLTALLLFGTMLTARSPFFGSFIYQLSVFIRPSEILFLPILFATWFFKSKSRVKYAIKFILGVSLASAMFLAQNWLLWGDALATSHARRINYVNGVHEFISLKDVMPSLKTFLTDWPSKIFLHPEAALLPLNSIILLVPFALWMGRASLNWRNPFFWIMAAGIARMCFAWSIPHWISPGYGPRYAFAGIVLCSISTVFLQWRKANGMKQ